MGIQLIYGNMWPKNPNGLEILTNLLQWNVPYINFSLKTSLFNLEIHMLYHVISYILLPIIGSHTYFRHYDTIFMFNIKHWVILDLYLYDAHSFVYFILSAHFCCHIFIWDVPYQGFMWFWSWFLRRGDSWAHSHSYLANHAIVYIILLKRLRWHTIIILATKISMSTPKTLLLLIFLLITLVLLVFINTMRMLRFRLIRLIWVTFLYL